MGGAMLRKMLGLDELAMRTGALERQCHALEASVLVLQGQVAQRDAAIVALRARLDRVGKGGVGDGRRVGLDPDLVTLDEH